MLRNSWAWAGEAGTRLARKFPAPGREAGWWGYCSLTTYVARSVRVIPSSASVATLLPRMQSYVILDHNSQYLFEKIVLYPSNKWMKICE